MAETYPDNYIANMMYEQDRKNMAALAAAEADGRINEEARKYLETLYTDGMHRFRQVFYILGKCFGAPKAAVMQYDTVNACVIDEPIKIADINPLSSYMVHHRLNADPMRNQFFTVDSNNHVDLSVSSIVSVIVGAQKRMERTLEKITGKYYEDYINNVADTAAAILCRDGRDASAIAIADKIRAKFKEKFITNASETVLEIIGRGHEKIAVEMVRELDKITKPHLRLRDVWRVKCLFDLVPQARTFVERIREMSPERIIEIRDSFYRTDHPRNYRDVKIILNIGNSAVIPMEIICQVRTFFEFAEQTHNQYEKSRKMQKNSSESIDQKLRVYREAGVRQYNIMICHCLGELFERVGWNILYSRRFLETLFDGFPKISQQYYPEKIVDAILEKLDNGVENEVFKIQNAPRKLSKAEEMEIFRWMAKFVLVSAVPYMDWTWQIPGNGQEEKFFNFIMSELKRYYNK